MGKQYQTFSGQPGASDSVAKLKALRLPDLTGKSFLDIGCNEGFFCGVAQLAGAAKVVGIDRNRQFIERARERFPNLEFHCQSWDEAIEGSFDVILIASSIHYAKDQPALLKKLISHLNPGGVLVVELGISNEPGNDYVQVRRPAGDVREYATRAALRRHLTGYAVRFMGPSVKQKGDTVPREVVHIRKVRQIIIFFDAPPYSGKSSIAKLLTAGRDPASKDLAWLWLDDIFSRMSADLAAEYPAHREIIEKIADFRATVSRNNGLIMKMLGESAQLESFLSFVEEYGALSEAKIAIWDGYVPQPLKEAVREFFNARGWIIWDTSPRMNFRLAKINYDSVLQELGGETGPAASQTTWLSRLQPLLPLRRKR